MPESDSVDPKPKPIFGQPETGRLEKSPKRKPNEEKPIELGLDIPRVIVKNKEGLTIPVRDNQIEADPKKTLENPFISFAEITVVAHGQRYGYGAGAANHTQINPGTSIRFLTPPTRSEGNTLNWFVKFGDVETGYIWTKVRNNGTYITYEKNKPPLINFIVEDIIS